MQTFRVALVSFFIWPASLLTFSHSLYAAEKSRANDLSVEDRYTADRANYLLGVLKRYTNEKRKKSTLNFLM